MRWIIHRQIRRLRRRTKKDMDVEKNIVIVIIHVPKTWSSFQCEYQVVANAVTSPPLIPFDGLEKTEATYTSKALIEFLCKSYSRNYCLAI